MELTVYRQSSKIRTDGTIVYKGEDALPYADGQLLIVADGLGGAAAIRHTSIDSRLFDEETLPDTLFSGVFEDYSDPGFLGYVKKSFFELYAVKDCYTDNVNNIKKSGYFASRIVSAIVLHEFIYNKKLAAGSFFGALGRERDAAKKAKAVADVGEYFTRTIAEKLRACANNANIIYESSYSGLSLLGTTLTAMLYRELGGDVIIKPLDTQGSRGVQICHNASDLESKYEEAARWSSNRQVIVERFATGREFVVEGIAVDYEFANACIGDTLYFDLPDAFAAKSRIFPTVVDDELRQRVLDLNTRIITGFGLKQGITHSEFIMDGDEIYLIETAARGGGVFISSDLIHLSCGLDTEKFLLDIATGKQKGLPEILPQQCVCGYLALYIPTGTVLSVKGVKEVQALPFVHRNQLGKLRAGMVNEEGHTDKTSRLALIVSAPDRETFDARAKMIREMLQVETMTKDGIRPLIWE